ncbi:TIR domain-containing protein [Phormidium sp. LEGE 05292]|uniref:WD40 domain-containing protein n=1 Tax=[Phormidium] sp. LEGE 05292 TaxID=767427 RepID=UPI0018815FC9|nr:TIR domain-containing protein [Phormidium sp. LEGE 05292]MBE9228739.1 TIR domain-containing protein [Phormidium sp. LEGE 05292]
MTDIFISYSRRDRDFVKSLHQTFIKLGRDVWVDWEDIPLTADWKQEIFTGIEGTDNFLFILSPDSIKSQYCGEELEYAIKNHKRLIPVVYREVNPQDVHPTLAALNWIFIRNEDDFYSNFHTLLDAIDTDLDHVRTHTRLLKRAIEWHSKKYDPCFLLRGTDLKAALKWLTQSQEQQPSPTSLHKQYIIKSNEAESKRHKRTVTAISFGMSITTILTVLSFGLYQRAEELRLQAEKENLFALSKTSEALFVSEQRFDALVEAIRAGMKLKESTWAIKDTQVQNLIITELQQAIFWVMESNQLEGHIDSVQAVAWSPDGELIATASEDRTTKIWHRNGTLVATLQGHKGTIWAVDWSLDGKLIATASDDNTVKIWNRKGQLITTLKGHKAPVYAVVFSRNNIIATGGQDKTVKLWNSEGKLLRTLQGQNSEVWWLTWTADGKSLATAGNDKLVRVWDLSNPKVLKPIFTLAGHTKEVNAVSFSPDGKILASASADKTVKLWNVAGKKPILLHTLFGHTEQVYAISFAPNGKTIATGSFDNTAKIWKIDGTLVRTLKGHKSEVYGVAWSPDSKMLVTGSFDSSVKIWHLDKTLPKVLSGHEDAVSAISFSPDGHTIASASWDKTVKMWQSDGKLISTFKGHTGFVRRVSFSPDGKIIATTSSDNLVKLWNREGKELKTLVGHEDVVNSLAWSPDGKILASASNDKTVKIWDVSGNKHSVLQTITAHKAAVLDVAFSPDGKSLVTASADKLIKHWTLTGKLLATFTGHTDVVNSVTFSPDGQLIVSSSDDKTVRIWQINGKLLRTMIGHSDRVWDAIFSPQQKSTLPVAKNHSLIIASASIDRTVKLWQLDGTELVTLKGHKDGVISLSFSPDGKMLASGGLDNNIILWNLQQVGTLDKLLVKGCRWIEDYLKNNPNLEKSDRQLCESVQS